MDWIWPLYQQHVMRQLARKGDGEPDGNRTEAAFLSALRESSVTVLVQEPWRGSVRFKRLSTGPVRDHLDLLRSPEAWLLSRYGGGKFKLNFHHGRHFVATRNFKPEGPPRWKDVIESTASLAT